jgi:signal transduction histidine kinase
VGATLFFKDLTRVEQLEERERLRDRLAALGEMAAAIAHEVKNPLAGIEVMAGILKRQLTESPDAQGILADIIKEAKMANVIVQEVLAFVRPIRLQVEDIAVADVIRDAITMAESHASLKGEVDVRIDLPEALRPIQGDPHQLRQIFTNLLTNAFEAMGGVGQVEIAAIALDGDDDAGPTDHGTGPTIQITIRDNGPGIPPESWIASSARSSRPSRKAPAWASPSSARSSTRTTGGSTWASVRRRHGVSRLVAGSQSTAAVRIVT